MPPASARGQGRFAVPEPGDRRFTEKPPAKPGVNGTPSWTAAAAAGLALAVVAAAAPSLLVPSVVVVVLSGILLGRRGRTVWWALLPSAALFVPFGVSVLDRPRALLADPGVPLGFDAAPLWQQVLGQPLYFDADGGLAGLPLFDGTAVPWALLLALLIGLPVLVLATAALFVPGKRARVARALWVAGLIILAGGWLAGHVATAASADTLVTPFSGPAVSAAGFMLLGAAMIGAEGLLCFSEKGAEAPATRRIVLRSASVLAMVLLLAGPLAGMTAWAAQNMLQSAAGAAPVSGTVPLGTPRQIAPTAARTLPATAIDRGQGPETDPDAGDRHRGGRHL